MDPILVDVNVHRTKLEVRFSKEKELTALIESIVKEAFNNLTLIPQVTQSKETKEKQKTLQMDAEQINNDTLENIDSFEAVVEETVLGQEGDEDNGDEEIGAIYDRRTITEQHTTRHIYKRHVRVPPINLIGEIQGTYMLAQNESSLCLGDEDALQEIRKY